MPEGFFVLRTAEEVEEGLGVSSALSLQARRNNRTRDCLIPTRTDDECVPLIEQEWQTMVGASLIVAASALLLSVAALLVYGSGGGGGGRGDKKGSRRGRAEKRDEIFLFRGEGGDKKKGRLWRWHLNPALLLSQGWRILPAAAYLGMLEGFMARHFLKVRIISFELSP